MLHHANRQHAKLPHFSVNLPFHPKLKMTMMFIRKILITHCSEKAIQDSVIFPRGIFLPLMDSDPDFMMMMMTRILMIIAMVMMTHLDVKNLVWLVEKSFCYPNYDKNNNADSNDDNWMMMTVIIMTTMMMLISLFIHLAKQATPL